MLKDIIKTINSAIPSLFPVDPTQFNDPVAMQTEWKEDEEASLSSIMNRKFIRGRSGRIIKFIITITVKAATIFQDGCCYACPGFEQ